MPKARKAKATKSKRKPTPKPQPAEPTLTKLAHVIALCQSKTGSTLDAIAAELKISCTAASSLIGDARAKGIKIGRDAGSGRYSVVK